jgi:hypothetical protein
MLNVDMLNVIMLNVIMLNVIMLNVLMPSVLILNVIMLNDLMVSVFLQNVVAPPGRLRQPQTFLNGQDFMMNHRWLACHRKKLKQRTCDHIHNASFSTQLDQ